jgi:hypothetical protein
MGIPSKGPVTLKTNLADYPVTIALKQRKASSPVVWFDFCGPPVAHDGFKGMVRDNKFDAGELAIITFLQAKAYGNLMYCFQRRSPAGSSTTASDTTPSTAS